MGNPFKQPTTKRRRRKTLFNTKLLEEGKEVQSLPEFFVMMQYGTDSPSAYCSVLSRCRRKESPGLNTMAVTINSDGSYQLLFDPKFNDIVKEKENWETVRMILIHEFIHLQDEHVKRSIQKYMSETDKSVYKKVNPYAIDFACNSTALKWELYSKRQLLSGHPRVKDDSGKDLLDEQGRPIGEWRGVLPSEEPFCLPDNLSYERYYKLLKDILKGKPPKQWKKPKSGSGGTDGEGTPPPTQEEIQERLAKCQEKLNEPRESDKRYVHIEDLDLEGLSEEDLEAIIQESEKASQELSKELLGELKSRGLGEGKLAQHIESKLAPPQIPWSQVLKNFVRNASLRKNKRKSIRTQNKRKEDNGIWSPFPGKEKDRKVKLLAVFDTSGSVSDAEFNEMKNEILALHSMLSDITVVYCDSEISNIEKLTEHSEFPKKIWGRGGTSFDPPFKWAIDTKFKPDIIIYGTDGECPLPAEHLRIKVPVLWLVTSRGCLPGAYFGNRYNLVEGKLYDADYGVAVKLNQL